MLDHTISGVGTHEDNWNDQQKELDRKFTLSNAKRVDLGRCSQRSSRAAASEERVSADDALVCGSDGAGSIDCAGKRAGRSSLSMDQ